MKNRKNSFRLWYLRTSYLNRAFFQVLIQLLPIKQGPFRALDFLVKIQKWVFLPHQILVVSHPFWIHVFWPTEIFQEAIKFLCWFEFLVRVQ